jgi:putative endonuclease
MDKFYYVYVLQSEKDRKFYIGCASNIKKRLEEHNSGKVSTTRNRRPLKLIYWEGCLNQQDAASRERYLKTTWGKRYIKSRLKEYITGQSPKRSGEAIHLLFIIDDLRFGPQIKTFWGLRCATRG